MGKFIAGMLMAFPTLLSEIEAEFQAVAHGEGGVAKVAAVAAPTAQLAATVAQIAAGA